MGTAIEPTALVGTPAPLAASFPSQSAADSTAQQSRTRDAVKAGTAMTARAAATEEGSPPPATQAVIDSINAELLTAGKSLELSVDSESNRSVVILRDTATGDVIGQFPTEQVLRMQTLLGSSNPHLLVDTTA
jgi:uncharacterized FlaG/YvyC family protein